MFSEKIKELQKKSKLTQEELAELIGMTRTGFRGALANDEFKGSTLLKLAHVFKVPVSYFFEKEENAGQKAHAEGDRSVAVAGDGNFFSGDSQQKKDTAGVNKDSETVKMLKQLLAEKDRLLVEKEKLLEEKERVIQLLMGKR